MKTKLVNLDRWLKQHWPLWVVPSVIAYLLIWWQWTHLDLVVNFLIKLIYAK